MGKFISVPTPLYQQQADMANPIIGGATSATLVGHLTYGTGGFEGAVSVGDIVLDTDNWVTSIVTAIDSDTELSISGAGNKTLELSGANFKIWPRSDAYSLKKGGSGSFGSVRPGDFVLNSDTGRHATVTSITSATEIMMDTLIFDDNGADTAVIISRNGFGCHLVNLKDILMPGVTAGGAGTTPLDIEYKESNGTKVVQIEINEPQADYSYSKAWLNLMEETMASEWTHVVNEMPLIPSPSGSTSPVLYATGVVWS